MQEEIENLKQEIELVIKIFPPSKSQTQMALLVNFTKI